MQKSLIALALGSTAMLGACANNPHVAEGAAIGGVAGGAIGAATGAGVIEGAAVGAAIGGLAGATWADPNNSGYVTGYTYNGQYYPGAPPGYDPTTHAVLTGAAGGAAREAEVHRNGLTGERPARERPAVGALEREGTTEARLRGAGSGTARVRLFGGNEV